MTIGELSNELFVRLQSVVKIYRVGSIQWI